MERVNLFKNNFMRLSLFGVLSYRYHDSFLKSSKDFIS